MEDAEWRSVAEVASPFGQFRHASVACFPVTTVKGAGSVRGDVRYKNQPAGRGPKEEGGRVGFLEAMGRATHCVTHPLRGLPSATSLGALASQQSVQSSEA